MWAAAAAVEGQTCAEWASTGIPARCQPAAHVVPTGAHQLEHLQARLRPCALHVTTSAACFAAGSQRRVRPAHSHLQQVGPLRQHPVVNGGAAGPAAAREHEGMASKVNAPAESSTQHRWRRYGAQQQCPPPPRPPAAAAACGLQAQQRHDVGCIHVPGLRKGGQMRGAETRWRQPQGACG